MRAGRLASALAGSVLGLSSAHGAFAQESPPKAPAVAWAPGVPVTFTSKARFTTVYLARGDVSGHTEPDPFERIGVAPVTVHLAPGTYTVETEGAAQSNGHERFVVEHDAPLLVRIHPGDPSLKALGGVLLALGIASIALGVVAIVSFSRSDSGYDRWAIGLPLTLGGAGGAVVGWAFTAAGSTDVSVPHPPPGGAVHSAALVPTLTVPF